MNPKPVRKYDFVIIGGGFFGLSISKYLRQRFPDSKILVIEKEKDILLRASRWNQARVHMGYHYPRSVSTAIRSGQNYLKFLNEWGFAVDGSRKSLYCISTVNSKTNANNFQNFLKITSLKHKENTEYYNNLLNASNISKIYEVYEDAFSANSISKYFKKYLAENNIDLLLNTIPESIVTYNDHSVVNVSNEIFNASYLFNCTYSGIGKYDSEFSEKNLLKHEIAEIIFVKLPNIFDKHNITIMDGPFFSLIYSPDKKCHTFSHVRYTPHFDFSSQQDIDPYEVIDKYDKQTNYEIMKLDSTKFFPELAKMDYVDSFFEVKTVLNSSEFNDSREILIKKSKSKWDILGSKIDQVYDVFSLLDNQLT